MAPARIAVIGAGLIGRKHIAVLSAHDPDFTLASVADPAPEAKAEAATLGYTCYAAIDEMLDKEKPDGVIIAVPNQLHVSAGLACIARKLPILIEKPVADTLEEALRLIEAAEAAGVPTLVGHHRRHNPIMRTAAEIIRSGRIGRVVAATALWLAYKPKGYHDAVWRRRPGGGPVLINAIHDIDCLRMLVGEIESVQATASSAVRRFEVEDTAAAVLRFANGTVGTLIVSDTAASRWSWETTSGENPFYPRETDDCYRIAGTLGSLAVPSLDVAWYDKDRQSWGLPMTVRREPVAPADPYVEQMRHFARVIRGQDAPVLSGRDGTRTLAATLAISISAKTGAPVRVDDLMRAGGGAAKKASRQKR